MSDEDTAKRIKPCVCPFNAIPLTIQKFIHAIIVIMFFVLLLKQTLGNMPLSLHSFLKPLLSKPASAFKNKPSTLICASCNFKNATHWLLNFVKIMMFARYGFRYSQRNTSSVSQIQGFSCVRLLTPLISNRFSAFCSARVTAVPIHTWHIELITMLTKEVYPKRLPFALFASFSEMVEYSLVTQNYITEQCSYWKLVPLDACFQLVQDAVDYFYNVSFAYKTKFCDWEMGKKFRNYRIFVECCVHMGVFVSVCLW